MNSTSNGNLFERGFDIIPAMEGIADANSDITGDRINAENYERLYYCVIKPAGTAGDDLNFQPLQHTAASDGSSKVLTVNRLFHKVGTLASVGQFTEIEFGTASSDFDLDSVDGTDLTADTGAAVILVEVVTDNMDGANGYTFLSMNHEGDDVGNALNVCAFWIGVGNRYLNRVPLSALA